MVTTGKPTSGDDYGTYTHQQTFYYAETTGPIDFKILYNNQNSMSHNIHRNQNYNEIMRNSQSVVKIDPKNTNLEQSLAILCNILSAEKYKIYIKP